MHKLDATEFLSEDRRYRSATDEAGLQSGGGKVWWIDKEKVGLPGIEPGTSRLSGARSNRLSYKPTRSVLRRIDVQKRTSPYLLVKNQC